MELPSCVNFLHEDIYLEILTRLDPKSLARFKLVSKHWYSFLSHPSFARLYFKKRPSSITGFFYQTSQKYQEKLQYVPISANQEPIPDPPSCLGFLDDPAILLNSCNGLLHWSSSWDHHFISNPLTSKSISLTWPVHPDQFFACGIAMDPSLSDHFEIVVLMVGSQLSLKSTAFSSSSMDWGVEMETLIPRDQTVAPYCRHKGVFLNGYLYWELRNNSILAYKVNRQSGFIIQLPAAMKNFAEKLGFDGPGCLGYAGGRLHYCRVIGTVLCIWVTTQDSSMNSTTWVHEHLVNLSGVMCESPSIKPHGSQALAFLDNCGGILMGVKNRIIVYWLHDSAVQEVCKGPYIQPSMFFPFVHSLAFFNGRAPQLFG